MKGLWCSNTVRLLSVHALTFIHIRLCLNFSIICKYVSYMYNNIIITGICWLLGLIAKRISLVGCFILSSSCPLPVLSWRSLWCLVARSHKMVSSLCSWAFRETLKKKLYRYMYAQFRLYCYWNIHYMDKHPLPSSCPCTIIYTSRGQCSSFHTNIVQFISRVSAHVVDTCLPRTLW